MRSRVPELIPAIKVVNCFESHFISIEAEAVRFICDIGLPNVKVHSIAFHMITVENRFAGTVRNREAKRKVAEPR